MATKSPEIELIDTLKLLLKRLKRNVGKPLTINTLGKKSKVSFIVKSVPHVFCRNSFGNECDITAMYKTILKKYIKLKKSSSNSAKAHLKPSNYNANKWPEAPDRNFAPYVAALIAFFYDDQ